MNSKRLVPGWVLTTFLLLPNMALANPIEVRSGDMRIQVADDGHVQITGDQLHVQTPAYGFQRSPYLDRSYRYRRPDLSAFRRACNGQADTQEQVYTQRSPDGSIYQRSSVVTRVCR